MPAYPDADLTLPSVVAALNGSYRERQLVLTVIFHPDVSRIGETAVIPEHTEGATLILGRRSPLFARNRAPLEEVASGGGRRGDAHVGKPIAEAHVSRQAISLCNGGKSVTLRRLPASSRCRVGGRELSGSVAFDVEQLTAGVPIMMGHSVVLLLRLVAAAGVGTSAVARSSGLVGGSTYMAGLQEQIQQVAASDMDVLIRGETGTGKELVAAAIHRASCRAERPLVCVNMAAIPPGLAAASLFGSARGAFTGASAASKGYFVEAQGGTLLLDEIGDTPPDIQPQLLRVLQQREIQAVGGAIRKVDVRVISATDAALEGDGCDFKAALRHRLGACEICLLPLREHPEDIGELLIHFLRLASADAGLDRLLPGDHSTAPELAGWAELFHRFLAHSWPGNVRELANLAGRVVLASRRGLTIPAGVSEALAGGRRRLPRNAPAAGDPTPRRMGDVDEAEFASAWRESGFEPATTARRLGVSRQAVYRHLAHHRDFRLAGQLPVAEMEQALARHGGDTAAAAAALEVSVSGLRARLRACGDELVPTPGAGADGR